MNDRRDDCNSSPSSNETTGKFGAEMSNRDSERLRRSIVTFDDAPAPDGRSPFVGGREVQREV
ncbi:hypothetical protein GA0061078_0171 [Bifidobacterium bohemicum]|uniref:Uncharacterized protein n=1 Tax=Bifidobacterium bohemicum DSM 22767 TaxID=1437606 RepID=A0A086ZG29_9BIFI|nr:hypothetical protein BBOH_1112 [Bifidobacterium bohemicum DSM 22767]SCB72130.1 hypothetical protein GA0061078_0171 [Bifidobacterium bohemicum]